LRIKKDRREAVWRSVAADFSVPVHASE
jgi:hypothetical protein